MPPVGFETTISAGKRALRPAQTILCNALIVLATLRLCYRTNPHFYSNLISGQSASEFVPSGTTLKKIQGKSCELQFAARKKQFQHLF
jgi:hypothetical protein